MVFKWTCSVKIFAFASSVGYQQKFVIPFNPVLYVCLVTTLFYLVLCVCLVTTLDVFCHFVKGETVSCIHITFSDFVLHLRAEQIDHPILITECVCNPVQSRSKMAELLFETYGVPSIGKNTDLQVSRKL